MGNTNENGNKESEKTFVLQGIITPKIKAKNIEKKHENIREKQSTIDYTELNNFINEKRIQTYLSENKEDNKDKSFQNLKDFEFIELQKIFDEKYNEYITEIQKEKINKYRDIISNKDLIEKIIENENSSIVYKKKIKDEILSIKNNEKRYQINYLKILLVGRKGVGKTTLIKYMLNLNENKINNINSREDFEVYENKEVPYLKLVKFKGIGLDKDNDPKIIGNNAVKCIQKEITSKSKNGDYNDLFHCIWYCISGTRFEESEMEILSKLSEVYNDKKIPIIIVYTQNIDNTISNAMSTFFVNKGIKNRFIKVLAKDMNLMFGGNIKKAFGKKELLNETLKKCTMALQGDMINFMINTISDDVKNKIISENKLLEKNINDKIIKNFINEYKYVLSDEELKNYITLMIGNNLFPFYENYNTKITNKSLNLLKKSNIINSVDDFIKKYKPKVYRIIEENLIEKSQMLLDQQAAIEKNSVNIRLENKRYLKGFEKSIISFIKRNFYYISQKIIINYIIKNFCWEYIMEYREKLDDIVISNLKENNRDIEINDYLKDCFLLKLEKFAEKYQLDIKIIHPYLTNSFKKIQDEEIYDKGNENENSILIFDDFNYGQENQIKTVQNKNGYRWFPFRQNKFKYLKSKSLSLLNDFMENKMEYQDIYFKNANSDKIFEALKNYELNDLKNFFDSKKINFINEINDTYNEKNIKINDIYSLKKIILSSKQFEDAYTNKINKEIEIINGNETFCKIEYFSVIVIGQTGVGKSTLINGMLNEELAKTGGPEIVTLENEPFKSKNMPFLRLIDTRGIELNIENGPDNILKNAKDYINQEKSRIENENKNNYSDYIHCIWYCISHHGISEKEIEIIQKLKNIEKTIPIIPVYTNAQNREKYENVKRIIKEKFNDMKLIAVRAKKIDDDIDTFGLNDLLNETLSVCKGNIKGILYKKIRKISYSQIIDIFKERNDSIKININNEIINKFIKFNKLLEDKDLLTYIFDLLENIFIAYLKENQKLNPENKDLLFKITNIKEYILSDFIQHYKNTSSAIIRQIENKKAIEFLDEQVRKEKNEFKRNINNKNKSDKKDFINIIRTFLSKNFYYLSQKYVIYRTIVDAFEQISDKVESLINDLIIKLIEEKNPHDLLKEIYFKKCEDLKERIYLKGIIYLKGRIDNSSKINNNIQTGNIIDDDATSISRSVYSYSGKAAPPAPNI